VPKIVYPDADSQMAELMSGPMSTRIDGLGGAEVFVGEPKDEDDWVRRVGDAEAIILGWAIPPGAIRRAPNLKTISFTGIGAANNVDLPLCAERGIIVSNTPGYADQTVAEHTLGLMLACARHIVRHDRETRNGGWPSDPQGMDLNGRTLGLVGLGGIGRRTASLARAFGMKVLAWTRNPDASRAADAGVEFVDLDALLGVSDIVSLHLSLTAETKGMFGEEQFAAMKPGAILINTARGELVDESAFLGALSSGRLASAGLDVYHQEPLPRDHPLIGMENVVLTPHTGFNTPDAVFRILDIAIANLEAWHAGTPINVVSP